MSGAIGCTLRMEIEMTDLQYPIWAIKRRDDEKESPVNKHGHPGFNHALWYWWRVKVGGNVYQQLTWEAAMNRIEFHNQDVYNKNSYRHDPFWDIHWERLSEDTWRILKSKGGNRIAIATLVKTQKIKDPESTYRWYRS